MNTHDDLLKARFHLNMGRITGLVKLGVSDIDSLKPKELLQSDGVRADIRRTIIVFLHATFEDVLRTMARQRIAAAKSDILDKIPLVGTSRSGRAEKFHLGALIAHRGKTVDQLIQESVENYLDRESFGSCHDVDEVLTQIGLDTAPFKPLYPDLDQMMKRRHRIVHEADLPSPKDSVSDPWTIGDDFNLAVWLLVVVTFYTQLRVSIDPADELMRWYLASRMKAFERAGEVRGECLIAPRDGTPESVRRTLQNVVAKLREMTALIGPPSDEEMLSIWKQMKSPDDDTTEEQARAKIVAWRDNGK